MTYRYITCCVGIQTENFALAAYAVFLGRNINYRVVVHIVH